MGKAQSIIVPLIRWAISPGATSKEGEMFNCRKTAIAATLSLALGMATNGYAQLSPSQIKTEESRIAAEYQAAKNECKNFRANVKDICVAKAEGAEKVSKAELEVRRNDTAQTRHDLRVARAEASYEVAKERCDDFSGNAKDVCIMDAKAVFTASKAEANAELQSGKAQSRADERATEARANAAQEKRKAEYAAAKERCDTYAGAAKERCVAEAKNRYQMN